MIKPIALALLLAAATAAADEAPDRWNLADLYPSVKAWHDDAGKLRAELKTLAACRGHLGESATRLRGCVERSAAASKRLARLEVYAEELLAEDTGVPESLELSQQARVLSTELSQTTAFMRPELLRLGAARIEQF
ncbi:MAG TPA: oligoendopeptidase F, partial [Burkholderiales bacterium]|nr:oligoendopeptidase F [Burkholderiales bacterium]